MIIILSLIFLFFLFFQEISEMDMFKRTLNMFNESDSSLSHEDTMFFLKEILYKLYLEWV